MKTTTVSITNSLTAITPTIATKTVTIMEDPSVANWPTTDYIIAAPTSGSTQIQRSSGTSFSFTAPGAYFPAGKTIAYAKIVTGTSTTFQMIEDGMI